MATLFAQNVEQLLLYIVPIAVLFVSLRRTVMSRSFNRILYAIVATYSIVVLASLWQLDNGTIEMSVALRLLAYCTLWYWLVACSLARTTGSSTAYLVDRPAIWNRLSLTGLASGKAEGIDGGSWASLRSSPAQPAAQSIPSGPAAVTPAAPGTV